MTGPEMVTMTHPTLPDNDPIRVPKSVVSGHQQMGWVVQDDQGPQLPPEAPQPARSSAPSASPPAATRARSSAPTEKE